MQWQCMIHVCNVHTESYSPAQHGRSVVAEDRGIWNPILNIGPYVTIDIDTARGKSSGQRCGGCCVRTRESQGQGAHCTVYSVQCTPAGPGLWRHGHSDSYSYLQHPALLRSWDHHLDTTITITPPPNLWPPHPPPPWWLWQWIPPRWRLLLLPRWSAWEDKSVESVEINLSIMDSGETMRWLFNLGIS